MNNKPSDKALSLARQILDSVGGGDWTPLCYINAAKLIDAALNEARRQQEPDDLQRRVGTIETRLK